MDMFITTMYLMAMENIVALCKALKGPSTLPAQQKIIPLEDDSTGHR